jgi:hypothetical protein
MADKLYCNVMNEPLSHQLSGLSLVNCTNVIDFGIICSVGTDELRKPIFPMDNASASSLQESRITEKLSLGRESWQMKRM